MAVLVAQSTSAQASTIVDTDIPARLDRLPWSRFHTLVVFALGITWVLDGLEVTLAGAVAPALKHSESLHFSNADVGFVASAYLAGAVLGALGFGWLTDRLGRKRLFFITLAVYLVATGGDGAVLERGELRGLPLPDRRRHRRRIHRDQLDDPGTGAGALSRLDRPRDQRQLLDRGGARCGRFHRAARSGLHPSGSRLAAGVSDRRGARPHHLRHADVDTGIAALADDPRPRAGGRGHRPGHRGQRRQGRLSRRRRRIAAHPARDPRLHARWRKSPARCFAISGSGRWSVWP